MLSSSAVAFGFIKMIAFPACFDARNWLWYNDCVIESAIRTSEKRKKTLRLVKRFGIRLVETRKYDKKGERFVIEFDKEEYNLAKSQKYRPSEEQVRYKEILWPR